MKRVLATIALYALLPVYMSALAFHVFLQRVRLALAFAAARPRPMTRAERRRARRRR